MFLIAVCTILPTEHVDIGPEGYYTSRIQEASDFLPISPVTVSFFFWREFSFESRKNRYGWNNKPNLTCKK